MADFAHLESPLHEEPEFFCEPVPSPGHDPRLWPEIERQAAFVAFMRKTQPHIEVHSNANAGKRGLTAQRQAKREGLKPGVFDVTVAWDYRDSTLPDPLHSLAFVEFKGFSAAGRPGELSAAQIEWGNAMSRRAFPVACFFTAKAALEWLRGLGAPIRGRIAA